MNYFIIFALYRILVNMIIELKKLLRVTLVIVCALFLSVSAKAQETSEHHFRHGGMDRTYHLYIPDNLAPEAPLVFVLHGYGGKAEGYRPEMIEVARENGFALCYPQGEKDTKGKTGWIVGYPSQQGVKTDDIDFICSLARHLQKEYGLSKKNTFFSGMSNGGEMCYIMAYLKPDMFAAFASIAGLSMKWSYKKFDAKKAVPFMEVHGTMDKTSRWEGDPFNEHGWGEYLAVPLAVGYWATEAGCTHEETIELPLVRNQVILHKYMGGEPAWEGGPATEVRLYEVVGGKHSWALNDMDTCREIWNFFKLYLR